MLPLPELQKGFAAALLAAPDSAFLDAIEPDGLTPAERVQIYANHFRLSLSDSLGETFPVVKRLLGEECFAQLARRFVRRHPPTSPCLFDYGGEFGAFLRVQPALESVPYVADVAGLEWAMNQVRHARGPDEPAVPGAEPVSEPDRIGFVFSPATALFRSDWPVDQIWAAHRENRDPLEVIELEPRPCRLLVYRDAEDDLAWIVLPQAALDFVGLLRAGHSLQSAIAAGRLSDAGFSPAPFLHALIGAGIVTDTVVLPAPERSLP